MTGPAVDEKQAFHPTDFVQMIDAWAGYQVRPVQIRMMQAVEAALHHGHHLMVEAGTGAGKSFGYLLPALLQGKRPIVISTGSIALQEQLLYKDVPALAHHLYGNESHLKVSLVKGRGNYLCIHKLEEAQEALGQISPREHLDTQQARLTFQSLRTSIYEGWEGDRADLEQEVPAKRWKQVASDAEDCLGWQCRFYDQNPYRLAREHVEKADVIITNHALYCQDLMSGGALLPPHDLVIFDEAHSLQSYAMNTFSTRIGRYRSQQLLGKINKQLMPLPDDLMWALKEAEATLMHQLFQKAKQQSTIRLYDDEAFNETIRMIQGVLYEVLHWVNALDVFSLPDMPVETKKQQLKAQQFEKIKEQLQSLIEAWGFFQHELAAADALDRVNWAEIDHERLNFQLVSTPLDLDVLLRQRIWDHKQAILTSATLSVRQGLRYFNDALGLNASGVNEAGVVDLLYTQELVLPSAFDTKTQMLGYIPTVDALPEMPQAQGYWTALAEQMSLLLEASQGRAFILFTSHSAMDRMAHELSLRTPFPIRKQGDFPRQRLIEWFKTTPHPVLLGTYTFWEGIDIPGDQLSLVMIDRLPFTAPDEPIHQATVERFKRRGEDWFHHYALPQAIIKLKQGMGRLLRTPEDRGVLALLDTRLRSKGYGRSILSSLPKISVVETIEDVQAFFQQGEKAPSLKTK
ncbi:MAG: ATP-dependent DNA helicase [Vampirovibrio sp.]